MAVLVKTGGACGSLFSSKRRFKGILCDITGVLIDSNESGDYALEGSIDAIQRIKDADVPIRFCTNETQITQAAITAKLNRLGFETITSSQVFPPAPAVKHVLKARDLRPHLLVHPEVLPEFSDVNQQDPNCVVLGDADVHFSYENVNKAFQTLVEMSNPVLIALGKGRYYKGKKGLQLDVGSYAAALEFACDIKAEVVGKPSQAFFESGLNDMGLPATEVIMIGDDIVSDVGGAQACGISGVQVRTGKFRPSDEPHAVVTPAGYVDNLAMAVDWFLEQYIV